MSILIVEDNPEYIKAAKRYFSTQPELPGVFAEDYVSAQSALDKKSNIDGALIDCFFPYQTGSGDTTLGKEAFEKLLERASPLENETRRMMNRVIAVVSIPDEFRLHLRNMCLDYAYHRDKSGFSRMLTAMNGASSENVCKYTLSIYAKPFVSNLMPVYAEDGYGQIERAMASDEHEQPLGIEVAQTLGARGISWRLVSSRRHHSARLDAVLNYVRSRRWPEIVDVSSERDPQKDNPQFWERATHLLRGSQ